MAYTILPDINWNMDNCNFSQITFEFSDAAASSENEASVGIRVKSLKSEKSELEGGLSDYLSEYQRLSGSNEIEGDDGEIRFQNRSLIGLKPE
jgi:hypothetical protein